MNNIVVASANIIIGLLTIALSIPLVMKKIKMNHWYGIRVPASFTSESDWYRINEYGGKLFIYWSIPILLAGIVLLFLPPLGETGTVLFCFVPLVILIPAFKLLLIPGNG